MAYTSAGWLCGLAGLVSCLGAARECPGFQQEPFLDAERIGILGDEDELLFQFPAFNLHLLEFGPQWIACPPRTPSPDAAVRPAFPDGREHTRM